MKNICGKTIIGVIGGGGFGVFGVCGFGAANLRSVLGMAQKRYDHAAAEQSRLDRAVFQNREYAAGRIRLRHFVHFVIVGRQ